MIAWQFKIRLFDNKNFFAQPEGAALISESADLNIREFQSMVYESLVKLFTTLG